MDIYRDAKRRGIYPPLFTDPEGNSCFSIYQIRWIKKRFFNFFFQNFRETTRHFPLGSQNGEYPRIFRVTGANQNARKLLYTDLVNTKYIYIYIYVYDSIFCLFQMCSTKCVSPNGQIETEGIKAITKVTSNIAETVNSGSKDALEVVERCQIALSNSFAEVDEFMNDVTRRLEVLQHFLVPSQDKPLTLKEKDERNVETNDLMATEMCETRTVETLTRDPVELLTWDHVEEEHLQSLSRRDGEGLEDLHPPTDPSKKICDDLKEVDNTTREKFDSLLEGLKKLEGNFQGETEENKKKRSKIQGKLQGLRDLIMNRNFSNSGQ